MQISANLAVDVVDSVHFALMAKFEDVPLTNDGNVIELSAHPGHCSMFFSSSSWHITSCWILFGKTDLAVVSRMTSEDIGECECIATND